MEKVFKTRNMSQAAYLMMNGLKLSGAQKIGERSNNFEFVLEDPDEVAQDLVISFLSSDCHRFDNTVRSLRGILNSSRGS